MTQRRGFRMSVALLLSPLLCLQACATTNAVPDGAVLSRRVVEDAVELQADPDTASHLPNAEEVKRLRDAHVIPLSLVIRNVSADGVIVGSAGITLVLSDGRSLRAIQASAVSARPPTSSAVASDSPPSVSDMPPAEGRVAGGETSISEEPPPEAPVETAKTTEAPTQSAEEPAPTEAPAPPSKAWEATKQGGKMVGGAFLGGMMMYVGAYVVVALVVTSPLWGPPVLISMYVTRKSREQRALNATLERLDPVYLAKGEAVGGVVYFALEDDLPVTLATATVVVPVSRAGTGTGEPHPVRLRLGKAE